MTKELFTVRKGNYTYNVHFNVKEIKCVDEGVTRGFKFKNGYFEIKANMFAEDKLIVKAVDPNDPDFSRLLKWVFLPYAVGADDVVKMYELAKAVVEGKEVRHL